MASQHFAPQAAQLAAQCALLFGWEAARFWDHTPEELAALAGLLRKARGDSVPPDRAELARLIESQNDG